MSDPLYIDPDPLNLNIISKNTIITSFESKEVVIFKTIENNNITKNWIRAIDVAKVLNIKCIYSSVQNYDTDEKGLHEVQTLGGAQKMLFLTTDGIYRLLFNSKKPEAKKFRKWACKILNDVNFNNCQEIKKTLEIKIVQNDLYNETNFYIRILLPKKYASKISKEKDLNINVIKPGIAFSLRKRNFGYNEEITDNGYFVFSFSMNSRPEAEAIEKIYKINFKDITVYGSTEYLDTTKLAIKLKFDDFIPNCYESYLKLAKLLFDYIVNLVKLNFSGYENHFGYMYTIEEKIDSQLKLTSSGSLESNDIILTTTRKEIQQEITQPQKILNQDFPIDTVEINEETNDVIVKIIGRDLKTGIDTIFDSITDVCLYYKCSRVAFTKTYLDKPYQYRGKHWRRRGNKIWLGIKNLIYNEMESYNFYESGYVKALDTINQTYTIYEGYQSAQKYTKIHPYTIRLHVKNKAPYKNILWSILPFSEYGKWIDDTMNEIESVIKIENTSDTLKKNSTHYGKIIALNLKTNEEFIYDSLKQFSNIVDVSSVTLLSSFVNKPRQVKGYHIRFENNGLKWTPPSNLIYDDKTFQRLKSLYIVSINSIDETDQKIYESQTSACKILNFKEHSLKYPLKYGSIFHNCYWKYVTELVGTLEKI